MNPSKNSRNDEKEQRFSLSVKETHNRSVSNQIETTPIFKALISDHQSEEEQIDQLE